MAKAKWSRFLLQNRFLFFHAVQMKFFVLRHLCEIHFTVIKILLLLFFWFCNETRTRKRWSFWNWHVEFLLWFLRIFLLFNEMFWINGGWMSILKKNERESLGKLEKKWRVLNKIFNDYKLIWFPKHLKKICCKSNLISITKGILWEITMKSPLAIRPQFQFHWKWLHYFANNIHHIYASTVFPKKFSDTVHWRTLLAI